MHRLSPRRPHRSHQSSFFPSPPTTSPSRRSSPALLEWTRLHHRLHLGQGTRTTSTTTTAACLLHQQPQKLRPDSTSTASSTTSRASPTSSPLAEVTRSSALALRTLRPRWLEDLRNHLRRLRRPFHRQRQRRHPQHSWHRSDRQPHRSLPRHTWRSEPAPTGLTQHLFAAHRLPRRIPCTNPGLGNTGRNQFRGPGYIQDNISLFKSFNLFREAALETRIEAFQLSNTPQFATPTAAALRPQASVTSPALLEAARAA